MTVCVQKVAEGSASGKQASQIVHCSTPPPPYPTAKKKNNEGRQRAQVKENPNEDKDGGGLAPETRRASCQERVGFCEHGSRQSPASWARVQKHGLLSRAPTTRPASLNCATTNREVGAQPSAAVFGTRLPFPQAKRPSRRTPCRQAITSVQIDLSWLKSYQPLKYKNRSQNKSKV